MSQHLQNCPAAVSMSAFIPKYPRRRRRRLQQDPACAQCTVVGLRCSSCTVCRRAAPGFTARCCTRLMSTNWDETATEVTGLNQMSVSETFRQYYATAAEAGVVLEHQRKGLSALGPLPQLFNEPLQANVLLSGSPCLQCALILK